jgi:cytoskeletal protein RodZ
MAGEGEILKNARIEKGLSLEDVEKEIKIRPFYLRTLEEEDYSALPGTTYARGFLRTYSKFLGLDSDKIIQMFNADFQNEEVEEEEKKEKHKILSPIPNSTVWFRPVVLVTMALVAVGLVVGITYVTKIKDRTKVADFTPAPLPASPEISKNLTPEGTNNSTSQQGTDAINKDGLVAELTFKEDCWLQVKVDGKTVLDGYTVQGATQTLQGKDRIEFVTVGNAGALTIKVNGTQLAPLGSSQEVVRNYVITPESLKNANNIS